MPDEINSNEQQEKKKAKRYYWLKLQDDFFKSKEIKKLRLVAGGDTYTIIYLKMMLLSVHTEGIIGFDGIEDTIYEELALELDENAEDVRLTVNFLLKYGLMVEVENDGVLLTKVPDMIGSETSKAELMRRLRAERAEKDNLIALGNNVTNSYQMLPYIENNNINNIYNNTFTEEEKEKPAPTPQRNESNSRKTTYTADFEKFWEAYPRKEGKGYAFDCFKKARKESGVDVETLIEAVNRYKQTEQWQEQNGKYIPQPSTWLNQKRWEDSPQVKGSKDNGSEKGNKWERAANAVRERSGLF